MHRILEQVCAIAERERAEWLPEVTPQQLEQDGVLQRQGKGLHILSPQSLKERSAESCE